MHLSELLSLRSIPAAGVSIGVTRRCPLKCAHCSTNSTMASEQAPGELFLRFVDTFRPDSRPEVLSMSGGEALLRPELVRDLAERARRAGARSTVLSGLFFATASRIAPAIREAIAAVDHFSVSIDAYHEQQVPRPDVFRVLGQLLADGVDLSVHVVGQDAGDPYIDGIVGDIRREFGDRVPMLVNAVSAFGRARTWLRRISRTAPAVVEANPCAMAAWPVVGFDGTIVACGNDDVLDDVPPHLRLGHAASDDWAAIEARTLASGMVRALRLFGPEYMAARYGDGRLGCDGYCATCMRLSGDAPLVERIDVTMAKPSTAVLEAQATALQWRAGALAFARRHGVPRYAELALLGAPA